MATCELCGNSSDKLKKTKIEGATLKACADCSDLGETVSQTSKNKKTSVRKKKKRRSKKKKPERVLINNYGKKMKKNRESKDMSIKKLSDNLNEKESVIKNLENEKMKPNKKLARKIKKKLGIELYTNPEVTEYGETNTDDRKATLGDVADLKE